MTAHPLQDYDVTPLLRKLEELAREGKGLKWRNGDLVECDTPGLNGRGFHQGGYEPSREKRPQTVDPFLPSGDVPAPSCAPTLDIYQGLWAAGNGRHGWHQKEGEGPMFETENKKKTTMTRLEYNPTEREEAIDDILAKSLWNSLEHFSDRDIDAFAIAVCYAAKVGNQSFWIFGSDILDHRGIIPKQNNDGPGGNPRDAGHRKEDIIPYGKSYGRLSNIWVTIRQIVEEEGFDRKTKRRKKRMFTCEARLLTVEEVWYQKEIDPETGAMINGHAVGWKIRVGEWLTTYLMERGKCRR
jgi:hypothetical protein